ncbi:MAG: tetratricopeptide repeat protein [Phycisphaerae bacterium]|nr:tetratricopeptide repeat protein [Gemmatimonadaceae bacterium]
MRQAVLANTAALIGGLVAMTAGVAPLSAQAAPSGCNVDQNKPKELTLSYLSYTKLSGMPVGPGRDPVIKTMLKEMLDKPEKYASNPAGYNYVLTLGLSAAATQPGGIAPTTRGAMGLTTRPTEPFDAITELDAAYKRWEAAMPACAPDIAAARNSEAWLAVTNAAFGFVSKTPNDSAIYYAKQSILLSPKNPFAHHILAEVAKSRSNNAEAVAEWKMVMEQAGADTSFRDIRQNALFYSGLYALQDAAKATGDASKTLAQTSAGYFREFLKVNPTGPDAASVLNNLSQALQIAGDTEGLKAMYMEMVADPSKYNESLLATGGVMAATANDMVNAGKLFAAMVETNPLSRDGLRNLASTLHDQGKYLEMYTPLRKLVEIDPNNFDGWMLFAHAAAGMEKGLKTATEKKPWTDTLTKYATLAEKLNARVEVTGFTRGIESADLTAVVEQAGAGTGNYTVTVDFLDKAGAVLGTASESTGPIAKGEKKTVTVKAPLKGVVAFRYKPLG